MCAVCVSVCVTLSVSVVVGAISGEISLSLMCVGAIEETSRSHVSWVLIGFSRTDGKSHNSLGCFTSPQSRLELGEGGFKFAEYHNVCLPQAKMAAESGN